VTSEQEAAARRKADGLVTCSCGATEPCHHVLSTLFAWKRDMTEKARAAGAFPANDR
jgi:hypothetical protein